MSPHPPKRPRGTRITKRLPAKKPLNIKSTRVFIKFLISIHSFLRNTSPSPLRHNRSITKCKILQRFPSNRDRIGSFVASGFFKEAVEKREAVEGFGKGVGGWEFFFEWGDDGGVFEEGVETVDEGHGEFVDWGEPHGEEILDYFCGWVGLFQVCWVDEELNYIVLEFFSLGAG